MNIHAISNWYNKNHKKILIIPALILLIAIIYQVNFYIQTGDFFNKDVSLTGGTSYTIQTETPAKTIEEQLNAQFKDFTIKASSDNSGNQIQIIITTNEADSASMKTAIEKILGITLTEENSSIETTSSSLSQNFYKQLMIAIVLAFFWMAATIFIIFAKGWKIKAWVIIGNLLFAIFLGNFFLTITPIISIIIFLSFIATFITIYIRNSIPAFAVMLCAFADIIITLAIVNFMGMQISTAGIVAFLMLIGYSVDTDVLLTTRVLQRKTSMNNAIWGAFKTGMTMSITSILAVSVALIVVYSFGSVLNQIFTILIIGLVFDIFNTWVTNASIIKWYVEKHENHI